MQTRTHDQIRRKFALLRETCDPRGFELLDELENACLRDSAMLALHDRLRTLEAQVAGQPLAEVIPMFACDPDESAGFSVKVPDEPTRFKFGPNTGKIK